MLELFPQLHGTRMLRQWTGLSDMTPDYSPILGVTEVDGFIIDCRQRVDVRDRERPPPGSSRGQIGRRLETPEGVRLWKERDSTPSDSRCAPLDFTIGLYERSLPDDG